jgi:hypothetical protein
MGFINIPWATKRAVGPISGVLCDKRWATISSPPGPVWEPAEGGY